MAGGICPIAFFLPFMELPILLNPPALVTPLGQTNAGGLVRLRVVPAHLVRLIQPEAFPQPGRTGYALYTVSSQHLTFLPGASLSDIGVVPAYASFLDGQESGPNGDFFKPTVQIILPKVRPDVVAWVQQYRAVRWLAFLQDRNGFCRLAGTPHQPLALSAESAQPLGLGNNQTVLTFTASVEQPAYFLTGVEDADLLYAGPFSDEFGFMFDS